MIQGTLIIEKLREFWKTGSLVSPPSYFLKRTLFIINGFMVFGGSISAREQLSGRILDGDIRNPVKNLNITINVTQKDTSAESSGLFNLTGFIYPVSFMISCLGYEELFSVFGGER
ncbi:MAG: hypothetical protein WCO44_15300 [Bacteroidota bacterium]